MKQIAYVFIIASTLISCGKGVEKNSLFIRGRLFLTDTITQDLISKSLSNKKITLAYDNNDSLNYLYSTKTDSAGYFIFNLPDDKSSSYIIRFEDSINSYIYSGKMKANKGDDNVVLVATLDTLKQNGFVVHLKDVLSGSIPNATILLFNSEVLANTNDPAGALQILTSNIYGKSFKINLPVGTYFLNAKKQAGPVTLQILKKKIIISNLFGIVFDSMILQ